MTRRYLPWRAWVGNELQKFVLLSAFFRAGSLPLLGAASVDQRGMCRLNRVPGTVPRRPVLAAEILEHLTCAGGER